MSDSESRPAAAGAGDGEPIPAPAIHLHPTAPLAERVLLPGDPGRALALAQVLLEKPLMFNHNRGLWGYTGKARDGEPLTIQATGMGGPSAAIVLAELMALGARRAIRVGTCGALDPSLQLGDLVVAREAICADGTSRALLGGSGRPGDGGDHDGSAPGSGGVRDHGGEARVAADAAMSDALARCDPDATSGTIVSVDLFYERDSAPRAAGHADAIAVEMEAAALFALGAAEATPVACLLAVTDVFDARGARTRIAPGQLAGAVERLGSVALAALA